MIQMTGAEFKRFYTDEVVFPEGSSWDDTLIKVDGASDDVNYENVADAAQVVVECGYIVDGNPKCPEDLVDAITWWRELQTTVECIARVPKEKLEAFQAAAAALGIEVTQVL